MLSARGAVAAPGLQVLIDQAAASGAGSVTLRAPPGQSELMIDAPLRLPPNLSLLASPAGLVIAASDDAGQSDRMRPVLVIAGSTRVPISDVTVQGFHLIGHFGTAPIVIRQAARVTIEDGEISGSRGNGIAVYQADKVTIARMVMHFVRLPPNDPGASGPHPHEGGAGIWCFGCNDTQVVNNTLDATEFWQAGPAWDSGNGAVCAPAKNHPGCQLTRFGNKLARALDMVAFYGGARDVIADNRISHGNTAAIYVNLCAAPRVGTPARSSFLQVSGNQIGFLREHGIDIVGADRPVFRNNRIGGVGGAGIALAGSNSAVIKGNFIVGTGQGWHRAAAQTAAIKLLGETRDSRIGGNRIDASTAAYAVYFEAGTSGNSVGSAGAGLDNAITGGALGIANAGAAGSSNRVWDGGRH